MGHVTSFHNHVSRQARSQRVGMGGGASPDDSLACPGNIVKSQNIPEIDD